MKLISPHISPPLDKAFHPALLANQYFQSQVKHLCVPLVIGLDRSQHELSRFETSVFPDDHPKAGVYYQYMERLVKM